MKIRRPRRPRPPAVVRRRVKSAPAEDTRVTVKCAFCKGSGKDPWGLPSFLSNCQVCSGRGVVKVQPPVKECAFCGGTGIQPYTTSRLTCMACKGKGWVTAVEPSMECPTCKGSGINPKVEPPLTYCYTCKGQGVVLAKEVA